MHKLEKWRLGKNLSRQQLAEMLGLVEGNSVYRYETGSRRPRPAIIKKLMQLSGGILTPYDFL